MLPAKILYESQLRVEVGFIINVSYLKYCMTTKQDMRTIKQDKITKLTSQLRVEVETTNKMMLPISIHDYVTMNLGNKQTYQT